MKILVISSANMDFVMNMKSVPLAGQTVIESGKYCYVPGGKGANSAMAFRRLGSDCVFCARLGNDENGHKLKKIYEDTGIDISKLVLDNEVPTGLAAIFVEETGANRIVVYPGSNYAITPEDIDNAFDCCPDAVFMQLEIPFDVVVYTSQKAAGLNIPVIIDAGPANSDFTLSKLSGVKIFSPNETETAIFTGISPIDENKCLQAAEKLESIVEADYYVIKLGERGAYVYRNGCGQIVPPFKTEVVDTTAAGDAFTAALTLEFLRSGDIMKSVYYANAVGAITVGRAGASTSIPSAEEVKAFLDSYSL